MNQTLTDVDFAREEASEMPQESHGTFFAITRVALRHERSIMNFSSSYASINRARERTMNFQLPDWVKPAAWGVVAGAVAIAIVGFAAGWVVTTGTAEQMAAQEKDRAVIAALTPVCVAQFKSLSQQEQQTQLAALEGESSWQRDDFVEEKGWATMPGTTDPNPEVANACATELMKLAGN